MTKTTSSPYLIVVRIPPVSPSTFGATTIYAAVFPTEQEALDAVRAAIPSDWTVEGLLGTAADSLVKRHNLIDGSVEKIA